MTNAAIPVVDLDEAYQGSYYTIAGCGGDLQEWVDGVSKALVDRGIGEPVRWISFTGLQINAFAQRGGRRIKPRQNFQRDLQLLAFSLDGLEIGRLAIFKLEQGDRWFDDVIDNMRVDEDDE